MKVLIVTLCDYYNYGNRLQNYALEQLLKGISCDVRSGLMVTSKEDDVLYSRTIWKRCIKQAIPFPIYEIVNKVKQMNQSVVRRERLRSFQFFSQQYLHMLSSMCVRKERDLQAQLEEDFDYCITGSDQVWNPDWAGQDYYFLTFAAPEKRISFAASFGVELLPPNQKERYARLLKDFRYISVREKSGAKLVKDLTGRDADIVLDPTLLLAREEWEKLLKKPRISLPEHYILSFFLGEEPECVIKRLSDVQGLPVMHMNCEGYPELYVLDPAEFLYVLKYADFVLTDSFHATIFSIKFEREFYVFHRKQQGVESMFTRISYLLERFNLENREQERDAIREVVSVSRQQWTRIQQELDAEREKTMEKMCKIMEI